MAAVRIAAATVVSNAATLPNLSLRSMPCTTTFLPSCLSISYHFSSSSFLSNPKKLCFSYSRKLSVSNPNKHSSGYHSSIVAKAKEGKRLPEATLPYIDEGGELQTTTVTELTQGKKIFLWTVRSQKNFKRCLKVAEEFKADGLDSVVIVVGNDASVVKEWKKDLEVSDDIRLLVDADSQFTMAMYVELGPNENPFGLGIYVEDGVVKFSAKRNKKGFGAP